MNTVYVDEYSVVDVHYIVDATPVDPCEEHDGDEWRIFIILHVGHNAFPVAHTYPTRQRRDEAFEKITALLQRMIVERERVALEDDEDEEYGA